DFELILCLPQSYALRLVQMLDNNAAIIGTITANNTIKIIDSANLAEPEILARDEGFQHF
ncbi:MAG: hypothetical protein RLZZ381_3290, partial [Cyanobacteriota bacterium]